MEKNPRFLVCEPDYFAVDYVINPWMEGNVRKASPEIAAAQWNDFVRLLGSFGGVERIQPHKKLPDMVFTANAGVVLDKKVVLSRFMHHERQGEEPHFEAWFRSHGYEVFKLPPDLPFEGAGDALWDTERKLLWAAYGFRSELDTHPMLAEWLKIPVISLRLIDPRFYHLDTCLCPLENGYLLYFPQAFDAASNAVIEKQVLPEKRIAVRENDAVRFACNAINIGHRIIVHNVSVELRGSLERAGFEVMETPLDEFMKAGGAAKCLTLNLSQSVPKKSRAYSSVLHKEIVLEGHLLDSGLLDRALEMTLAGGGSFQILHFDLGKQRQSTSRTRVRISAPSEAALKRILERLLPLGASVFEEAQSDVQLESVSQDGVAPDDFYATTIYPTEIRVDGDWSMVADQRMDAVITVQKNGPKPVARCRLFRDLKKGDLVVTGNNGIRTQRRTVSRDVRSGFSEEKEFGFMGAAVSSERRVELIVDQVAWEMNRIRERKGKIVVVAGPVVIHTGGGEHLAWLVRNGYVQALLGGNAIAVHDMEQAMLGTSLGVDLKQGGSVHGGHRHHLRVINTVRRCGGIRQTVEQGIVGKGIFYECVKAKVPFSLAGSIRDDGPLPDTEMDLIRAQADYAGLLKGADMVLMLSSMLHSIGVGNMTPAGVKMVCVDINPAVVTKLADRGSVESVGVVTDVGLFLSLLTQRLNDERS